MSAIQQRSRRGNSCRRRCSSIAHHRSQRIDGLLRERARRRFHRDENLPRRDGVGSSRPAFGLPETPGLKLVERLPPGGICLRPACYLACF
jgi:hypothetical protein